MAQLPDELVQSLLEEIERTGAIYAKAKANATSMEKMVGIAEAAIMNVLKAEGEKSVAAQKRDARAHPTYHSIIEQWKQAIEDEVNARTKNENAIREYEGWRTISANERSIR